MPSATRGTRDRQGLSLTASFSVVSMVSAPTSRAASSPDPADAMADCAAVSNHADIGGVIVSRFHAQHAAIPRQVVDLDSAAVRQVKFGTLPVVVAQEFFDVVWNV